MTALLWGNYPRGRVVRLVKALLLVRAAPRLPDAVWGHLAREIRDRDGNVCQIRRLGGLGARCGAPAQCVDHIVPKDWGGSDAPANLRAACSPCNTRKGSAPPTWWLAARAANSAAIYGAIAWLILGLGQGGKAARAGEQWAAVSSPAHAERVAACAAGILPSRAEAERVAAAWNSFSAGGAWRAVRITKGE